MKKYLCMFVCLLTFNLYSESIFNGKDLEGWSGNPNIWRVEGGAITADIVKGKRLAKNEFIFYKEDLNDFVLTLEYKILSGKTNSGIQIRSAKDKSGHAVGYQADLDDGTTWLGRIYDEGGRGLILERGTLTTISPIGKRVSLPFRKKDEFNSVPKKNDWNTYKIIARGHRIEIYINDIHFSTLEDYQKGQVDLQGYIALQIHSGIGPAKVQFKNIDLKKLKKTSKAKRTTTVNKKNTPYEMANIGFEKGDLSGWTATGTAFTKQPAKTGCITQRRGKESNASGSFFVGTYEIALSDKAQGTLTSKPFKVTHNWATLKVGGGSDKKTVRVEIIEADSDKVIYQYSGKNLETMSLKVADLGKYLDKNIFIRLIDKNSGGWGHINYDDFQFHTTKPNLSKHENWVNLSSSILRHLVKNPVSDSGSKSIIASMNVPRGFKVEEVVSPKNLKQPIAFTFDSKGRIWVAEAYAYPRRQKAGEGKDRLVIFEDKDGDGSFETRKVFADNLNLVSGFEIGYGGVFVGAAPHLLFIPDRDGDDKPDGKYEVLLDGWDLRDTHETPNSLMWGHDGWLYGNHGVFNNSYVGKPGSPRNKRHLVQAGVWRFHPVTKKFEVYAKGGSNQWGLDYNADGAMFMTHCRSYWGGGPVSQVMRDGHYWTQNNRGHSEFILPPKGRYSSSQKGVTDDTNMLLSVAAYGHGKGGAGNDSSRSIFGGHSHVGTMIYLGNNWPEEYKGQLYTHNLHGAQMNREFVQRYDSAYLSHSYGRDQLKVQNNQYLAVDLKYGPDGAVYFIDWFDKQHCHTTKSNIWDRSNGAVYRMQWTKTYKPLRITDLALVSNGELVKLLNSSNEWFSRMAQHILRQRAVNGKIDQSTKAAIEEKLLDITNKHRFRALVALYGVDGISKDLYLKLLVDKNDIIRSQTVHFITEKPLSFSRSFSSIFIKMAQEDESAMVRLKLAGACQKRLDDETALQIIQVLSQRVEDSHDRFIPKMLWYAYSKFARKDLASSLKLAEQSPMREFRKSVYWYVMKRDRKLFFSQVEKVKSNEHFSDYMRILAQILDKRKKMKAPVNWGKLFKRSRTFVKDSSTLKVLSAVYGKAKIVVDELQEKIARGKSEFALCAACHNPGKILPGPSLEEISSTFSTKEEIIKWVKNPGKKRKNYPQMPPFDKLSVESLDAIATYLLSIRSTGKAVAFNKKVLSSEYYSEGANFGDFNKDGNVDVVSGPYWYEGPDFDKKHEIYLVKAYPKNRGYANSFFSFSFDFNNDGWLDILAWGLPGRPATIYENPKNKKGHWKAYKIFPSVGHESPVFGDINKDGQPELLCVYKGKVGYAQWNKAKPYEQWQWVPIGGYRNAHGLGFGDINGDGKNDIIVADGWWENPKSGKWKYHNVNFGRGGAQMYAYDVDGDGDNDVITSLVAHGYGLAWFEQKAGGKFTKHIIMGNKPQDNKYGVCFSQLHAIQLMDINGDGLKDIITGKCFHAHNGRDPGAKDAAIMAYFELSRKGGKVEFIPRVFDRDSGLGRLISVKDINKDGLPDIVTANKKGVFLFRQLKK